MPWSQIPASDSEGLDQFLAILKTQPEYARSSITGLQNILLRTGGELWIFTQGRGSSRWRVALSVSIIEGTGQLKVVNCVPEGRYSPKTALRQVIEQVRKIADRLNCEQFVASSLDSYQDSKLQQFIDEIPNLMWELDGLERRETDDRLRLTFHRDPSRKSEDRRMKGPRIRKPPKRKKKNPNRRRR